MPVTVPQDIFNPILEAVGTDRGYKDAQAYDANIDFDKRVARQALPISRMMTPDGKVNKAAIANMNPYEDASQMWEQMNANMPKGRGIDPQMFQQKYQQGKQMHDMSLANQLNVMRQYGMSDTTIRRQFKENPGMLQYMYENGIMAPKVKTTGWSDLAIGAGAYATVKGARYVPTLIGGPGMGTKGAVDALSDAGFRYSDKYKSIVSLNNKELIAKFQKEGMSLKQATAQSKIVREAAKEGTKSFWGKQAIKAGKNTAKKKLATRLVMANVARTLGPKAGKGLLMWAMRGIGASNPWGIGAMAAAYAVPWAYNKLTADKASRWE